MALKGHFFLIVFIYLFRSVDAQKGYETCITDCSDNPTDPYCGTNGVTYRNRCELYNAICQHGGVFVERSRGACVDVDGNWGEWSVFGECTVKCGGGGRFRSRLCNNPPATNGGLKCLLTSGRRDTIENEIQSCNTHKCEKGLSPNIIRKLRVNLRLPTLLEVIWKEPKSGPTPTKYKVFYRDEGKPDSKFTYVPSLTTNEFIPCSIPAY